mgnify:CR=1 FL=1
MYSKATAVVAAETEEQAIALLAEKNEGWRLEDLKLKRWRASRARFSHLGMWLHRYIIRNACYEEEEIVPREVVNIPVPLFESSKGRYFVGQSELLHFGNGKHAWSGLFNPCSSHVKLHVNVFTITNLSETDFLSEIWFNPELHERGSVSNLVTPSNRAKCPRPRPEVDLIFADDVQCSPERGVNAFDREVPAKTTIAQDEDGKYIIPAGESFTIFLVGQDSSLQARVAFGWWEESC